MMVQLSMRRRLVIRLILGVSILIFLFAVTAWGAGVGELGDALAGARWVYLIPMTALMAIVVIFRSLRLALMLEAGFKPIFHIQNVGALVNAMLPFRAGEMFMALLLRRRLPISGSTALSIIAVDRVLDLLAVFGLFLLTMPMVPAVPQSALAAGVLMLGAASVMAMSFRYRRQIVNWLTQRLVGRFPRMSIVAEKAEDLLEGLGVTTKKHVIGKSLLLSLLAWITSVAACLSGLLVFWPEAPIAAAAFAVCTSVFGTMLIAVPAGLGVMHTALVLSLGVFGLSADTALAFALVYHVFATAVSGIMGLVSVHVLGIDLADVISLSGKSNPQARPGDVA